MTQVSIGLSVVEMVNLFPGTKFGLAIWLLKNSRVWLLLLAAAEHSHSYARVHTHTHTHTHTHGHPSE